MSTLHPSHPMLHIIPCNKGMYHVYLNSGIDFNGNLYDKMEELFEKNFGYKDEPLKWSRDKCETMIHKINELLQKHDPNDDFSDEEGTDSEGDSGEEEDNEETIQQVLARRLKSESTRDIIQEEEIENSEDEDVISLSRRLRHIYSILKDKK